MFFRHLYGDELKELNWLCKHMKSSEAANLVFQWIFVLNSVKPKFFHVSIVEQFSIIGLHCFWKLVFTIYHWKLRKDQRNFWIGYEDLGVRKIAPEKNCPPAPPSGSELGLELTLELELGSNFSSGTIFLEPKTWCKYFSQMVLYYFIGKIFFCRTKEVSLVELPW